jgi:hypothetical protein
VLRDDNIDLCLTNIAICLTNIAICLTKKAKKIKRKKAIDIWVGQHFRVESTLMMARI